MEIIITQEEGACLCRSEERKASKSQNLGEDFASFCFLLGFLLLLSSVSVLDLLVDFTIIQSREEIVTSKQASKQHIHVEVLICLLQFHCCGSQDKGKMKVWGPCLLLLLLLPLLLSFLSLCRASAGDERLPYKLASRPLPPRFLFSIWKTMIFLLLYCLVERA
jgi:hypothetical protein